MNPSAEQAGNKDERQPGRAGERRGRRNNWRNGPRAGGVAMHMPDILQPRWLKNVVSVVLLLAVGLFLFPFLKPFAWGIWAAMLTWPAWQWLRQRIASPALAVTVMLILLLLLVGLPMLLMVRLSAGEVLKLINYAVMVNRDGLPMPDWLPGLPVVGSEAALWWRQNLGQPQGLAQIFGSQWDTMAGTASTLVRRASGWVVSHLFLLLFSLIVLTCIYIHGERIVQALQRLLQRLHHSAPEFMQAVPQAVRATAFGMGIIAILEGILLGVAYAIAGLPSPALFGLLSGCMALIPGGAPLSFTLASLYLYANGQPVAAVGLFSWGACELFLVDKFLRPKLIGHSIRLPFLPVFVGLVGGLQMFGLLGLVYGPAIMLLAVMLWRRAVLSVEAGSSPADGRGVRSPVCDNPGAR